MEDSKKLAKWQEAAKKKIEPILLRADFQRDLKAISLMEKNESDVEFELTQTHGFSRLRRNYGIPPSAHFFLINLASTGVADYSLIESPIQVYSDSDHKLEPSIHDNHGAWETFTKVLKPFGHTYIVLSPNITREELLNFVKLHWTDVIEPKLHLHGRNRLRVVAKDEDVAKREAAIIGLYIEGYEPAEISAVLTQVQSIAEDNGKPDPYNNFNFSTETVLQDLGRAKARRDIS
jgi:hypothetical protein